MRFVVFGGGMQGRVAAADLASEGDSVVIADVRAPTDLPKGVAYEKVDATRAEDVRRVVEDADACLLALPGEIARKALEHLVDAGARVADVSFTPEPPLDLDARAKATGACVVIDCGVAPGTSHILVGMARRELGALDRVTILVGGIPLAPPPHFRHAVYFNPRDLLAEYLRPARMRAKGRDAAPAPFDAPLAAHDDPEFGRLDAFLSDGLRTLLTSFPDVPDMEERTLRWPGHMEFMRGLFEAGLLDERSGAVDVTARALGSRYPADAHPDALVMLVRASRGSAARAWRLVDRRAGGLAAMARTTAFTTTSIARLLARRDFVEAGVHAPEKLGTLPKLGERVLADLAARGVVVSAT